MTTTLERAAFAHLIPHAGAMCLLARVVEMDAGFIRCEAESHLDPHNPLRNDHGLPMSAGIEYAAQSMALHAALEREGAGPVQGGAIAVLSDVIWKSDWLDAIEGVLSIEAKLLAASGQGRQYNFSVGPVGGEPAICGTLIVAFG